ncbi:transcriptional regulator NrdR [Suttonella indologenes]|uniref:Transcriptional repressor NrdR n=1 Tax=Suttonella indologenes TaxID=13276 RepID=A0A380MZS0_9GAMM|nr:transcriptional regulator NrdR [Suttonella indologenes]SUO98060.1 Transcriptional repressor NrdR [Suttonella indologenes]
MHCPICNHPETKVVDSRLVAEGEKIRRRRECLNPDCLARFTTYEVAEIHIPTVIKQNGDRESYSADKLRRGLLRACEKRPVSAEQISALIHHIEQQMRSSGEREISSEQIGQWVMEGLKTLDHVAYIRFASVYLSFADIAAFQQTIDELNKS